MFLRGTFTYHLIYSVPASEENATIFSVEPDSSRSIPASFRMRLSRSFSPCCSRELCVSASSRWYLQIMLMSTSLSSRTEASRELWAFSSSNSARQPFSSVKTGTEPPWGFHHPSDLPLSFRVGLWYSLSCSGCVLLRQPHQCDPICMTTGKTGEDETEHGSQKRTLRSAVAICFVFTPLFLHAIPLILVDFSCFLR